MQEWLKRVYEPFGRGSESVFIMEEFNDHRIQYEVNYMKGIKFKAIMVPKG